MIPILNKDFIKRENSFEEIKNLENNLKNQIKENKFTPENLIFANLILNRIKIRRLYMKIILEQFDIKYKKRFNTLGDDVKAIKNLIVELKKNNNYLTENIITAKDYFCEKLHKISPGIANVKKVEILSYTESLVLFEKLLKNMIDVSAIYEIAEYYKLKRQIQILNDDSPSFLIKAILEFNLFPKNENLLFYKNNYVEYFRNLFTKDLKFKFIEKETDMFVNMTNMSKELLIHCLKNKSRQIRNVKYLFDSLAIMVIEANHKEKEIKAKNKKIQKLGITSFFIKQILEEMLENLNICFFNEIFASYELDYVFYFMENLLNYLFNHTHLICTKFAEDVIETNDYIKNPKKSNMSYNQLLFIDELAVYNGLKYLLKGLCLIAIYLKKANLLKQKNFSEEEEKVRIHNRFINFKNSSFFFDFTFETFKKETQFDLSEVKFKFYFKYFLEGNDF